ncbi:hypothetical protein QBC34DRAFT_454794 [Podospora aff. communis PSN243]|uniref:Metallo-beta-lactamase domain-containing protein n=1 Tax=Podospora aff. communis PSN243 TaxID=3040156 RepID=A0AAV9FZI5_9PEZI|nr:hypothetical protein QBC34DRAFT_454794 [Podospora aff. communis PSN243]
MSDHGDIQDEDLRLYDDDDNGAMPEAEMEVEPEADTEVTASQVQLHMVYSGRGDAFYVTWRAADQNQTPHMIMVDAGPYKYDANTNSAAPYWEYLAWAGRRIWASVAGDNAPFRLDLIINTHPHDDHIGGLAQWLSNPPNATAAALPACPIILPCYYSARSQIQLIYDQTVAKHWGATKLEDAINNNLVPTGLLLKYPTESEVVVLSPSANNPANPPGPVTPLDQFLNDYFVDATVTAKLQKDLNYASLLLKSTFTSGPNNNNIPSQMFVTGDNHGQIITPFVKDKKLSIYKIQHHGSRFESMGAKVPGIPTWFRAETALLFTLLYYQKNRIQVAQLPVYFTGLLPVEVQNLQHGSPSPPAHHGLVWLAKELWKVLLLDYFPATSRVTIEEYIEMLMKRHMRFRDLVVHDDIPETLPRTDQDFPTKLPHDYRVANWAWEQVVNKVGSWSRVDADFTGGQDQDPGNPDDPQDGGGRDRGRDGDDEHSRERSKSGGRGPGGNRSGGGSDDDSSDTREKKKKEAEKKRKKEERLKKQLQQSPGKKWNMDPKKKAKAKPREVGFFYSVHTGREGTRSGGQGVPDPLPWWAKWSTLKTGGKWEALFGDVLRTKSSQFFFEGFESEAYVVSANSRHGHPTASCILGLSKALHKQRDKTLQQQGVWQTRVLYLTSPKSFPRPGLEQLHRVVNGAVPLTGLLSVAMEVHYLTGETYMSLLARSLAGVDNPVRVVDGNTVARLNTDAYMNIYNALSTQLEGGLPLLGGSDEYGDKYYSLYADIGQQRYCVTRAANDTGPAQPSLPELTLEPPVYGSATQKFQLCFPAPAGNAAWGSSKESTFAMKLRHGTYPEREYTLRIGERSYSPATRQRGWGLRWAESATGRKYMAFKTNANDGNLNLALQAWNKGDQVVTFHFEEVPAPVVIQGVNNNNVLPQQLVAGQPVFSMMTLTRRVANSVRVVDPYMPEVSTQIDVVADSAPTLRQYLQESTLKLTDGCKGSDALSAIVQARNYTALDLSLDYQKDVLGYAVDLDNSRVDYTGNDLLRGFNAASIVLQVPDGATLRVSKNKLKVLKVQLRVRWQLDLTLAVETYILLDKDNLLCSRKTITNAMGSPSLAKVLGQMGIASPLATLLCLPQLLAVLVRDGSKIATLLAEKLPTMLITAGVALIKPDLDLSTATISYLPNDQVFVDQATVICRLASDWQQDFSVAGVGLHISNLTVLVDNSGPSPQRLVFQGGLPVPMSKDLKLSSLGDGMTVIGFSVKQPVPRVPSYTISSLFATVNFADWKDYLPSGLVSKIVGKATVKVIIRNPLNAAARAVAVGVGFKIPVPVASAENNTKNATKMLDLRLSAEPLAVPTEYQYRLAASVPDEGLSIGEVVGALGLSVPLASDAVAAFPALQSLVLDHIFVRSLSVGFDHKAKSFSVADWSVELWIDSLVSILPNDVISIVDISLSLSRTGSLLVCSASARIHLPLVDKLIDIAFKPPTAALPGYLMMDAPYGLSVADLLFSFDLPSFDDVPVVKDLLKTELASAKLHLGVLDDGKSWTVYGGECTIRPADALVGRLALSEMRVFVRYSRASDPFGPGKEHVLMEVSSNAFNDAVTATMTYDSFKDRLSVLLVPFRDLTLAEPLDALLPGALRDAIMPVVGGLKFKMAGLVLSTKRPYTVRMFKLFLDDDSQVEVDFWQLKSLSVEYQSARPPPRAEPVNTTPAVPNGGTNQSVANQAGATDLSKTKGRPTRLTVVGVVSKDAIAARIRISFVGATSKERGGQTLSISVEPAKKDSLKVRGFLSLLGFTNTKLPVETPDNCPPEVFDAVLERVGGTFSLEKDEATQKSSLALQRFHILARSEGVLELLTGPSVKLDSIRANMMYERVTNADGSRNKTLGGFIEGHIEVCGLHVWARYERDDAKHFSAFTGLLTREKFDPSHSQIGLSGLGDAVQIPSGEWATPPELKLPEDFKVAAVGVTFIPDQCLEIYARGTQMWKGQFAGLELEIKELTALLRRKTAIHNRAAKAVYEVFLTGDLVFEGFVSAKAWLRLTKSRGSTLTALITKAKTDGTELESIANKMGLGDQGGSSWDALVPKPDIPLQFDQTGLFLHVDFKASSFLIYGQIQGVGSALLVGRKDAATSKRQFALFIEVRDLDKLWSSTKSDVTQQFDFENKVSVVVINFDTDVEGLQQLLVLEDAKGTEDGEMHALDDGKLPQGEPPIVPDTPEAASIAETSTQGLAKSTKIGKGAWFFMTIKLLDNPNPPRPMTEAVTFGLDAKDRSKAMMTLYAAMTADKAARHYMVQVNNLVLLGGCVEINAAGEYKPGDDSALDVEGDLTLRGLLDDADPIVFRVRLEKRKKHTRFGMTVTTAAKPEVKRPFHAAFPVTLKELSISGDITYSEKKAGPVSEYTLSGTAEFERQGSTNALVGAKVVFREGRPSAAVLQYRPADEVSTSDLCSSVIQPDSSKPAVWKTDEYEDFKLKSVTVVYLKEAPELKLGNVSYGAGLTVAAVLSVFQEDFQAKLKVDLERKGFSLEATYLGEINLFFAKLCRTGNIEGPTVKIEAFSGQNISFGVKSGLTLFDKDGFWFDLAYQPNKDTKKRHFKGKAGYVGYVLGKENPTLGIEYRNGRWGFDGWEMFQDMTDEFLPLSKVIEKGSAKDPCGAIVKLVWKETVTTKFRFEISLPTDPAHKCTKDELWGSIKWWYNIKFLDAPFTLDAMKTKLFDIITDEDNWESIGKALMDRPEDFTRLLAAVAFERLAEDAVAKLLCRGKPYQDPLQSALKAAKDIIEAKIKALKAALETAIAAATAAVGAATVASLVEGIALATSTIPGILFLLGALGLGVGLIIAVKIADAQMKALKDMLDAAEAEAKRKLEELKRLIADAKKRLARALVLSASPVAEFIEGEDDAATIKVAWDHALPGKNVPPETAFDYGGFAGVTWRVAYSSSTVVDDTSIIQTTAELHDKASKADWTFADVVYVSVRARFTDRSRNLEVDADAWTMVAVKHNPAPWLRPPVGLGFSVSGLACSLKMPPTVQDTGVYELWLTNPAKKAEKSFLYRNRIVKTTAGPETIDIPLTVLGPDTKGFQNIQACVRQISSNPAAFHDSPWFFAPESYLLEAAVSDLSAMLVDRRVAVSWKHHGRPAANVYDVHAARQDDSFAVLADMQQLPVTEDGRGVSFSDAPFAEGEQVTIAVQARPGSGNVLALVATSSIVISHPPVPVILDETTWDVPSNTLVLAVSSKKTYSPNTMLIMQIIDIAAGAGAPPIATAKQAFDSIIDRRGFVRLNLAPFALGLDPHAKSSYHVQVSSEVAGQSRSAPSALWKLPTFVQGLDLTADFGVTMQPDGTIRVRWPAGSPGSRRYVRLENPTDLTAFVEREWPSDSAGPMIARGEYGSLVLGAEISVFSMTRADKIVGYRERRSMTLTQDEVTINTVVQGVKTAARSTHPE